MGMRGWRERDQGGGEGVAVMGQVGRTGRTKKGVDDRDGGDSGRATVRVQKMIGHDCKSQVLCITITNIHKRVHNSWSKTHSKQQLPKLRVVIHSTTKLLQLINV